MSLPPITVQNAKPRDKAYKLADEKGLYLLVNPNGAKYWKFKYRFGGKEKKLSIGVYPANAMAKALIQLHQNGKIRINETGSVERGS